MSAALLPLVSYSFPPLHPEPECAEALTKGPKRSQQIPFTSNCPCLLEVGSASLVLLFHACLKQWKRNRIFKSGGASALPSRPGYGALSVPFNRCSAPVLFSRSGSQGKQYVRVEDRWFRSPDTVLTPDRSIVRNLPIALVRYFWPAP